MPAGVQSFWPDPRCAKAFWGQHELPPYRQLLADTIDWAAPGPGDRWLDLGCGGGAITRTIWTRTGGTVAEVVGVDCAGVNAHAYDRLQASLSPPPGPRVRFLCHDFSRGLEPFADRTFDHVASGLSISYAESFDHGAWTTRAYDRLLSEVFRVLRPGGRFVFSVNVPDPSWGRVARGSVLAALRSERPLRHLKRCWRMLRYGRWLKREARAGRFHYLPAAAVTAKLVEAGYAQIAHRLSYCDQAYIFRAVKAA
ncbi:class I SAM-dependent methyltransferase [Gemmata sp. JC717]|uniref:Class I SAM-dependent methyltransferase n=1 Tax=Gemmata algarum TaxID=2975278 RepID=A0ABU5F973_9BACT|nr:class I SAM-dependent methyltransferase [Gemmata algarum]MDY3551979.1 class I SAM-dependent methyltransferase [Gemmata algarum]MDY3563749.1 class I SAM-dependent methyltransferase [Gemmata algarum]